MLHAYSSSSNNNNICPEFHSEFTFRANAATSNTHKHRLNMNRIKILLKLHMWALNSWLTHSSIHFFLGVVVLLLSIKIIFIVQSSRFRQFHNKLSKKIVSFVFRLRFFYSLDWEALACVCVWYVWCGNVSILFAQRDCLPSELKKYYSPENNRKLWTQP